ncbi:hypothetical protein Mame01_14800 [Microbispora amethystogenes]|nr:hypothetical protein Mame01_14800 [Microbispora amethystogenes]
MVEAKAALLAVAGHARGDVDEEPFLFVWSEPHGGTIGTRGFSRVTQAFRMRIRKAVRLR